MNISNTKMKQIRIAVTLTACLLSGIIGMAQNTIVEGTNLDIGANNTLTSDVTGTKGHAIGQYNIIESHNSLAVGYGDTIGASATTSIALGTSNKIGGSSSFAIGQDVKVMEYNGLGIGRFLKSTGQNNCMVIGNGFHSSGLKPKQYLENPNSHSLMIGFNSIRPTFTVGPSPNDYPTGDTLGKTGKVAIGDVPIPDIAAKLHIRSDYGEDAGIILESKDQETANTFIRLRDQGHGIEVDGEGVMRIRSMDGGNKRPIILNGVVGINVLDQDIASMEQYQHYSLYAKDGVITTKVSIKRYENWWSDYVFDPDYTLMPLGDLRRYIDIHRHLPDIPSETEVTEEGIELGIMQSLLLKKIEELTLYTLQLQEQVESLQKEIDNLNNKK